MLFFIAGLGNPGDSYQASRHNIGFQVVDRLAERHGISWETKSTKKFRAHTGSGLVANTRVLLAKPQTFMNLSGTAVQALGAFFKIPTQRLALVHDDIDLALGRVQIRRGGGHGGHRGVQSVMQQLNQADFVRIRVGVDRPAEGYEAADYVLGKFDTSEQAAMDEAIDRACQAAVTWIRDGLTIAMNRVNPWSPPE